MENKGGRYKSLLTDSVAFFISNFASKILVFLLIPLYTSVLSTNDYGIADLLTNTVNVLYPILTLCIMEATLRYALEKGVNHDEVLVNSLIIVAISELLILIATPFVGTISKSMRDYWAWFVLMFLGFNLDMVFTQYAKGIGKTKLFAISGVFHTIVIIATNILGLLVFKLGLNAYLFSIVFGYFATVIFVVVGAKIRIKRVPINKKLLKEMLAFSIPTIPTIIAWWVNTSADKYIIIAFLGIASSGIYSVAYKIPSLLTMVTSIFTSAWTISAIKSVDDEDNAQYQTTIYKYYNLVNVLACIVLIMLSKFLGRILFAKDFFIAWKCVPMLLVAYLFSGLSGFLASSFRAAKKTKGLLMSTSIGALINIGLNFAIIPKFGIVGAAVTTMIGFAVTFYIRSQNIKKILDLKINLKKDSFIYVLLIIEAIIIGHEIAFSYVIGVLIIGIIVILYRRDLLIMVNIVISQSKRLVQKMLGRNR